MSESESVLSFTPSQLAAFLQATIPAGLPVLVTGAPGLGKSSVIEQATALLNCQLIISHPAVEDPTDSKGLPWFNGGKATFVPIGQHAKVLQATEPTVWLIDDLGQATPAVQAAYMQWLLARQCNGHQLPDCVTMIAATNRRTDGAAVSGILETVKSRFVTIVELQASLTDWCTWALNHGMPAELIAWVRFKPEVLTAFKVTRDMTNSPSPRTLAHAGKLINLQLPAELLHVALAGAIGAEYATELVAFLRLYASLPSVDAIIANPNTAPVHGFDTSTRYAIAGALAHRVSTANFARIATYCERMLDAGYGEFATLTVRDALQKHPELQQTAAYVKLQCGELGQIMSGAR